MVSMLISALLSKSKEVAGDNNSVAPTMLYSLRTHVQNWTPAWGSHVYLSNIFRGRIKSNMN